jgi:hypothetical protein
MSSSSGGCTGSLPHGCSASSRTAIEGAGSPGCGNRRFAQAHHLTWWSRGGRTELENLALICSFHHKLVHELGWSITRDADGEISWFRPDGIRYRAGPAPPVRELVAS